MDLGFQSLIGIYTIFYGVCFILPSKGNLPILPCWERRYLSLRAAAQIIDILQSSNKGLSLIENNGNLSFPCNLGRKKGNCSKVKMTLRRHSSPRVHDGNCWQKKVTVTVKDLSIKTWCLLHLRKASIWFVTDDQNLLCLSPPSISTGLGSRRCQRWQIKSNH